MVVTSYDIDEISQNLSPKVLRYMFIVVGLLVVVYFIFK